MVTIYTIMPAKQVENILSKGLTPERSWKGYELEYKFIPSLRKSEIHNATQFADLLQMHCPFMSDYADQVIFKKMQEEGKIGGSITPAGVYEVILDEKRNETSEHNEMSTILEEWTRRTDAHPLKTGDFTKGFLGLEGEQFSEAWVKTGELNRFLYKLGFEAYGSDAEKFEFALVKFDTIPEQGQYTIVADHGLMSPLLIVPEDMRHLVTLCETGPPQFRWMCSEFLGGIEEKLLIRELIYFTSLKTLDARKENPELTIQRKYAGCLDPNYLNLPRHIPMPEVFFPFPTPISPEDVKLFELRPDELLPYHEVKPNLPLVMES